MNQEIRATKKTQFKTMQYNNKRYVIDVASNKSWLFSIFTWYRKKEAYLLSENDDNRNFLERKEINSNVANGIIMSVVVIGGLFLRRYINAFDTNLSSLFAAILLLFSGLLIFLGYALVVRSNKKILYRLAGKNKITIKIRSSSKVALSYHIKNLLLCFFFLFFIIFGFSMFIIYHSLLFYFAFILGYWFFLYLGIATMRLPKLYEIEVIENKEMKY
ncbi:DUF443 family protein [Listeria kieliensis]|uniref:Tandem five-TM protein n=1 Tax=Listeria kieliensis TaxID=1621700 RepID=A0A3D8TTI0_9LIST|nr:DUF443 family protein [Listeria kieliensis]RDX02099.1 hypothetical protein UR08_00750 [Listeria kieliensis]